MNFLTTVSGGQRFIVRCVYYCKSDNLTNFKMKEGKRRTEMNSPKGPKMPRIEEPLGYSNYLTAILQAVLTFLFWTITTYPLCKLIDQGILVFYLTVPLDTTTGLVALQEYLPKDVYTLLVYQWTTCPGSFVLDNVTMLIGISLILNAKTNSLGFRFGLATLAWQIASFHLPLIKTNDGAVYRNHTCLT